MIPKPLIDVRLPVHIHGLAELRIRTALEQDKTFICDRSYRWRRNVGWLPTGAIESAVDLQRAWIVTLDDYPAGHVMLTGGLTAPYVLRHNCVEQDLWERGIGKTLTNVFLAYAWATSLKATAAVRTRADLYRQLAINANCGGRLTDLDKPKPHSNGQPVSTWHWPLSQRPRKTPRVPINCPITIPILLKEKCPLIQCAGGRMPETQPLGAGEHGSGHTPTPALTPRRGGAHGHS